MSKEYCSPNDPVCTPGKPVLNTAAEALQSQQDHNQWHRQHPGESCPEDMFSMDNWDTIMRGDNIMRFAGGGTVEPGDAFDFGKEK